MNFITLPVALVFHIFGEPEHIGGAYGEVSFTVLLVATLAWIVVFAAITRWRYQKLTVDAVTATVELVVDHASKWFGDLVAVSDVSFTVDAGVTALLGPNGAGKSTLLRMLCGLTAPSQGSVRVLGRDPRRDLELTREIGLVPQQEGDVRAPDRTRVRAPRRRAARGRAIPTPPPPARSRWSSSTRRPAAPATYSKGMRQRVKVAQALVHDPEVLVPRRAADRPRPAPAPAHDRPLPAPRARTASAWWSRATCSTRSSASARACS